MQIAIPVQYHKITPADLPDSFKCLLIPFTAGRGWLSLVCEARAMLPVGVEVLQVKEKFGALRIITNCSSKDVRKTLQSIEHCSPQVCEI